MTKEQADKMLHQKFEEMNSKTESAQDTDEYIQMVDGMLKVYTILCEADGFEKTEGKAVNTTQLGS